MLLTKQAPRSLIRAAHRLNPAIDVEVDVLAVVRAVGASTKEDWSGGTLTDVAAADTGEIRLAEQVGSPKTVFSSGSSAAGATDSFHFHNDSNPKVVETLWMDFFPDPGILGPHGFTLHSVDLKLGRKNGGTVYGNGLGFVVGNFILNVARFDENWNREVITERMVIPASVIPLNAASVTVDFRAGTVGGVAVPGLARRIIVQTGRMRTRTGTGRTSAGAERTADFTIEGDMKVSHLVVPFAFSLGLSVDGSAPGLSGAHIGVIPTATLSAFDTTQWWRTSNGGPHIRNCGPYSPDASRANPGPLDANPGYGFLETGAVPGYGAIDTATMDGSGHPHGTWGIARQVSAQDRPQTAGEPGYQRPFHTLKAVRFATSGTVAEVLDFGSTPTEEVHFRADTVEPSGTSVTFKVERSPDGATWTTISTALADGTILTGADLAQYYRVTATLTASPDGLSTPSVVSIFMTERVRYATWRYLKDIDSTVSVDPVTGQSEIGELVLPALKLGPNNGRDLVTRIVTEHAPSNVEAWVYVRETVTGTRHFVNLFRLEDREPGSGVESLRFVSGMDRLKVVIPQKQESALYPVDGSDALIASRTYNSTTKALRVTVSGTPFAGVNIVGWRYEGVTGTLAGTNWFVAASPAPTSSAFTIVLEDDGQEPAVSDHFRLHSDVTTRDEVVYAGLDYRDVYADILSAQAAVPGRYRGVLPPTTGRTTTGRLLTDGVAALDPLQQVALHAGGAVVWRRGCIDYVDFYGAKEPVATWSEKDYTSGFKPTVGADRRMPSLSVRYGYDYSLQKFAHEVTYEDYNAVVGWGRANLFDVVALPDELCIWNDFDEAAHLASKMLQAWSTGVRLWQVPMVHPWPWVELGDAVTISTDIYTDRRLAFSADGLTDNGEPVKGRTTAVGRIVGKNLIGTAFTVAIFGLDNISSATGTDGDVEGDGASLECPAITLGLRTRGLISLLHLSTLVVSFTPPDDPFYDHMEFQISSDSSGDTGGVEGGAIESPYTLQALPGITYTVTPYVVTTTGVRNVGTPASLLIPNAVRVGGIVRTLGGVDDGILESTRGSNRMGSGAAIRVDEDDRRAGLGGLPTRGARIPTDPLYLRDGSAALIDTDLGRQTVSLFGPTGTWSATVMERGGGKGDTALDSGNVLVAGSADFSRSYTGKHLGNMPDDATSDRKAVDTNRYTGANRGFFAIDSGNIVVAAGVDLSRSYVGKHLGNIPDDATSDRKAVDTNRYTGASRAFSGLSSSNKLSTGVESTATAADGKVGIESAYGSKTKASAATGVAHQGLSVEGLTRAGHGGIPQAGEYFHSVPVFNHDGSQVMVDPTDTGALTSMRSLGTTKDRCSLRGNTGQTLTNNTATQVTFDTSDFDVGVGIGNIAGSKVVIPADHQGLWVLHLVVQFAANATGPREAWIEDSTGTTIAITTQAPTPSVGTTVHVWKLVSDPAAGEFFIAKAQQASGGSLATGSGVNGSVLECFRFW